MRRAAFVIFVISVFVLFVPIMRASALEDKGLEEILQSLGVDNVAADYVVIVDTSASMRDGNLYGQVREALRPLVEGLAPADHLSLLTFDEAPAVRFAGPVGEPRERALAQLPPQPVGRATDIGAAIGRGLGELERPDAQGIGTIVLVTDGLHEPPAGSAYPATSGPAWDALAARARALTGPRMISSYALALGPQTDAALLKQVFSEAVVLALPPDQVGPYLQRVKDETRLEKARQLLMADLKGVIQVSWNAEDLRALDLNVGVGKAEVTLRSTMAHAPIVLTDLALTTDGFAVEARGLPNELSLAPGESRTLPVKLHFSPPGSFGFCRRTVTETGRLVLSGTTTSPWDEVLRRHLGLDLRPKLIGAQTNLRASAEVGWRYAPPGFCLLMLLFVLLILYALVRYVRQPRLVGVMEISRDGELLLKRPLGGRKARIKVHDGRLRCTVHAKRRRDDYDGRIEYGVSIVAKIAGEKKQHTLWSDDALPIGDYEIAYVHQEDSG